LGRYEILGEIAHGGMGIILKGRDITFGRDVAIKTLADARRDNSDLVRRFVTEARITGQLQHPGIVPIHDMGRLSDGRPCFVMKLVRGLTLSAF
jgi:serine/threonine-protein kinase